MSECPVCRSNGSVFDEVSSYRYYSCPSCDLIYIDPAVLSDIDRGVPVVSYTEGYWREELKAARERAYGVALARVAEVVLYTRRPIAAFLDIGSGPGYLLDALKLQLPTKDCFHAVELYPPTPEYRTSHPNYNIGNLKDLKTRFDCGLCMEVIEHMTPSMVDGMIAELATISNPGACYIFNTGLSEYVRGEDRAYLDPVRRGHIVSWSVKAVDLVAKAHGFSARRIPGKTWAFILEYETQSDPLEDVRQRIWTALPQNVGLLSDSETGNVLYVLGLDTARAYG